MQQKLFDYVRSAIVLLFHSLHPKVLCYSQQILIQYFASVLPEAKILPPDENATDTIASL